MTWKFCVALFLSSLVLAQNNTTSTVTSYPCGSPPLANGTFVSAPTELLIGGLFTLSGGSMSAGREREAAARFAINTINQDGSLLPGFKLTWAPLDTAGDVKTTVRDALTLCDNCKVLGIVGEAISDDSAAAALITGLFGVPQISYSSTATTLSNKATYPTFFRTCAPDNYQANAIVDICKYNGWTHISVINTDDTYGSSLSQSFQGYASSAGIEVQNVITIQTIANTTLALANLKATMQSKLNAKTNKIFAVFANYEYSVGMFEIANELNLITPDHVYLATDGTMQSSFVTALVNASYAATLATGLLGTGPATPTSLPTTQQFLQQWWMQNSSEYYNSGNSKQTPNTYMPYAYDCVQVFAHAMQSLVSTNQDVNTSSLIAAIRAVNFTGVTGQITFDVNQDRVGASYAVYNFQLNVPNVTGIANSSVALVTVGSWNNATGLVFSNASSLQLTTAGVPGAVPTDTIECDGMLVFRDDRCEACNSNEYFDTASSTCELCTGTQVQAADGVSCQYPGGIVALIVIIVLLGVGIIAAGLGFYIWRRVRTAKRAERAAESAPALPWDLQAERDELAPHKEAASGIVSTIDRSANFAVGMKVGEVPSFSLGKGARMPVNVDLQDQIVIVNKSSNVIKYRVLVPDGLGTFICTVEPGVGVVKGKSEKVLLLKFKLLQTMKVDRRIKVEIESEGALYFPLRFEGEVSQRLDPDEIELFGKPIGDGAFGTVYRGRYRGTSVAVKVLRRQNELKADQNNNFLKEIDLFQKLRNPYIVNFIGASYVPGKLCLCTELLERGTVLELLQKAKISLALKVKLMLDTACAIEFLHQNGVMYRDLKPDNLLVFSVSHNANVNCKLSDFGTARTVESVSTLVQYSTGIGTPIYMAPELMNASKYNCKVDVYSFAMVCWEIMAEKQPFHEVKRVWDLPRIVVEGLRPALDDSWPRVIQRLIADCWLQSHDRRPDMKEVTAQLQEFFEKERKNYEKGKKAKKKEQAETVPSAPTAHTGNLEALYDQGRDQEPIDVTTEAPLKNRADDMALDGIEEQKPENGDDVVAEKPKKKKKKAADADGDE